MRIKSVKHGDSRTERGNLRQREIDENHPPLHHMHAQVGMDASQNQAGNKGRQQKSQSLVHEFLI